MRELGTAGWTVGVGAAERKGVATASRWCARWHDIRSPVRDLDAFVADINRAIDDAGYEVLFASGDAEAMAISFARSSIRATVPYAPHCVLQRAFDKLELIRSADAAGVPVPWTFEANDAALASLTDRVVVKCRLHWEPGRNGGSDRIEARIAKDHDDARRHAAALRNVRAAAIYQEFKPGCLMGFTCLTDGSARVIAHLQQMAPFTWDPGVPTRAYTVAVDEHLSRCIARMLKELGWFGLVQLQFIFARDGRPYLIDFNGRAYMSEALAAASGLNFHDLWARMATGREWKYPQCAKVGVRYQWLRGDIRRSRQSQGMRFPLYILECLGHGFRAIHPIWQLDDPRPIVVSIQKYMSPARILKGLSRRLGNQVVRLGAISYRCTLAAWRGVHLFQRIARGILRRASSLWSNPTRGRPIHDQLVLSAAIKANLSVEELPYGFLRISDGKRVVYSRDFDFSFESLTAYWMCGDKHLTSLLLQKAGVPVPAFAVFRTNDLRSAYSAFHALKPPVVVKPCLGARGEGITVGVATLQELRAACRRAAVRADRIIMEQLITGRHWRITLFDDQLVFACERLPAFVVGDGRSSIRALVNQRNNLIRERDGLPTAYPIRIDKDACRALRDQSLGPDSVPAAGRKVVLKRMCNAAVGGLTADVTRNLHGDYLRLARRAAEVMGARLAGIDVIAPDATRAMDDSPVFINEVNTTPDLLLNHFDISGSGDATATVGRLLTMVFAAKQTARSS